MIMNLQQLSLPPFHTPFIFANPHVQTILPKFIKQPQPNYQRQFFPDSTGKTKVAYDFIYVNHKPNLTKPLAVMFHGLEGSSDSHYAKAFANYAQQYGWDAVIVHYRGCGGVKNTADVDYNAGDVAEIQHMLSNLTQIYPTTLAVGVSLGGNMLAKYMAEAGESPLCQGAVIISAPVDLATSAQAMHKPIARRIYTPYLLKPLLKKAIDKIDDKEILVLLKQSKTLDVFDDLYTAPRHGYGTAENYYRQASALPMLKQIRKPTLMISAKDDPFLGTVATVNDISSAVRLLYSEHGGHVGFMRQQGKKLDLTWLPETSFRFFEWVLSQQQNSLKS